MTDQVAVVVGVGPGLGFALARRFAAGGMKVVLAARRQDVLDEMLAKTPLPNASTHSCDATRRADVERLFETVERKLGTPALVAFNAGAFRPGSILDIDPEEFVRCWEVGCLAGLLVGQAAARRMVAAGRGTLIFTGATAALRGSANFVNLAVPKFGLRALAQSMARELGPKGVHVGHVVIDGQILSERYQHVAAERAPDALLQPDAIAETYWHLHQQPKSAWTFELDVRPWVERF